MGVQGMQNAADTDGNAVFKNFLSTYGAVPVGGRNFFRLLQNNESVVLFPGGVREVLELDQLSRKLCGHLVV